MIDIAYIKPIYYTGLITGLGCIIDFRKTRAKKSASYTAYCVLLILTHLILCVLVLYARAITIYRVVKMTEAFINVIQHTLLTISNVYCVLNQLSFVARNFDNYIAILTKFDKTIAEVDRSKKHCYYRLLLPQCLFVALSLLDYSISWNFKKLSAWYLSFYKTYCYYQHLLTVLQIYVLAAGLKSRFGILNSKLGDLSATRDLHSIEMMMMIKRSGEVKVRDIIKSHADLCGCVDLVNAAYGRIILLVLCSIVVVFLASINYALMYVSTQDNSVGIYSVALVFIVWGMWYLCLGTALIRICKGTTDEAWKTTRIAYEILDQISITSVQAEELYLLVRQIENRRPAFNAAGFFHIDYPLLLSIFGAVTSYFIILLQFSSTSIFA